MRQSVVMDKVLKAAHWTIPIVLASVQHYIEIPRAPLSDSQTA